MDVWRSTQLFVKKGTEPRESALVHIMRRAGFPRRRLHQYFAQVKPRLAEAPAFESWNETTIQVQEASDAEPESRDFLG